MKTWKISRLYTEVNNLELYELAEIYIRRCESDLRSVEKSINSILRDIEELDFEKNILRLSFAK